MLLAVPGRGRATACNSWAMAGQGASRRGVEPRRDRAHARRTSRPLTPGWNGAVAEVGRGRSATPNVIVTTGPTVPRASIRRRRRRSGRAPRARAAIRDPTRSSRPAAATCTLRRITACTGATNASTHVRRSRTIRRRARRPARSPARVLDSDSVVVVPWYYTGSVRHAAAPRVAVNVGLTASTAPSRRSGRAPIAASGCGTDPGRPAHPSRVRQRDALERRLAHDRTATPSRRCPTGCTGAVRAGVDDRRSTAPVAPTRRRVTQDVGRGRSTPAGTVRGLRRGDRHAAVDRRHRRGGRRVVAANNVARLRGLGRARSRSSAPAGAAPPTCSPTWTAPLGATATSGRRSRATSSTWPPATEPRARSTPTAAVPRPARALTTKSVTNTVDRAADAAQRPGARADDRAASATFVLPRCRSERRARPTRGGGRA